jgi:uncharacterized membrane protein YgdD (TMEM256/DUF423 family)
MAQEWGEARQQLLSALRTIMARPKHTIRWEASIFGVGSLLLAGELVAEAVKQLQQADPHLLSSLFE